MKPVYGLLFSANKSRQWLAIPAIFIYRSPFKAAMTDPSSPEVEKTAVVVALSDDSGLHAQSFFRMRVEYSITTYVLALP